MKIEGYYKINISREEIDQLPRKKFEGEIFYIDSYQAFLKFFPLINGETVLGIDTETKPSFKKGIVNEVSLLQLCNADKCFLFRLNRIGLPEKLTDLLSDKNIIKAGVALRDDIAVLKKLRPFEPQNFIDLQQYVKDFGIEDNGLKKLAANILGFQISKRQQTSNWEQELLTPSQIEYAATDAWVCYEIYMSLNKIINNNGKQS
jgi:ribonuclease D